MEEELMTSAISERKPVKMIQAGNPPNSVSVRIDISCMLRATRREWLMINVVTIR
jgi:hypothetical protein